MTNSSISISSLLFRNSQGVFITKGLFYEMANGDARNDCAFTLKDHTHAGLPSLKLIYMGFYEDPTEYDFAISTFNSWDHWQAICAMKWFKEDYLDSWRAERDIKLKSIMFRSILKEAINEESKNAFSANKYIIDSLKAPQDASRKPRGRPSDAEVNATAITLARDALDLSDDFKRISGASTVLSSQLTN
jgi:hypothetical protein